MSEEHRPETADVEETSSQLKAGLASCRSVVTNYRRLLNGADTDSFVNDNDAAQSESLSGIDER